MKRNFLLVLVTICLTLAAVFLWQRLLTQLEGPVMPEVSPGTGNEMVIQAFSPQKLDTTGAANNTSYEKEYLFRTQWFKQNIPVWETALAEFQGQANLQYLEVGLYEGGSALWMLENILTDPTARLTGLDLFYDDYRYVDFKGHKEVFYSNLELSGFQEKATIIEGFSQVELRDLPLDSYDIIYIDGSHDESDCLEDLILSWRLLKVGGMLICDDYMMEGLEAPHLAIDTFNFFYGDHFEVVHVDKQVFLKKISSPSV